jgi:hypothetical protein
MLFSLKELIIKEFLVNAPSILLRLALPYVIHYSENHTMRMCAWNSLEGDSTNNKSFAICFVI